MASELYIHNALLVSKANFHSMKQKPRSLCKAVMKQSEAQGLSTSVIVDKRRSANYKPSSLSSVDHLFLHSSASDPVLETDDDDRQKIERLKSEVKMMLKDTEKLEPLSLLKLIDDIQRLGVSNHFEEDIKSGLSRLACIMDVSRLDLGATSLLFRLLRQNGFSISQDVFERFKDDDGNFMESEVESLLNLYEASYFAMEGEELLDEAKASSTKHINEYLLSHQNEIGSMRDHVKEALELPLRYRSPRVEGRRYMEIYSQKNDHDDDHSRHYNERALLELAKLDFNQVQSTHRNELQEMSKWWRGTGLAGKLNFSRDRLTEAVFFAISTAHKPELSSYRRALTKVVKFIALLDDIYDIYGHFDELRAFTSAIERWDINAIDGLPEYMKLAFLALYNTVNEIGYGILKETGFNCIPFLKKSWEDMCKAFLVEAKWYCEGRTPSFEEYLENAWVSVSGIVLLTHAYFTSTPKIDPEAIDCLLFQNHELVRLPCMIFRLSNDLATSQAELERGETANAISCYAKEAGVTVEDAKKHMKKMIDESWKGLNRIATFNDSKNSSPFSNEFVEIAMNLARTTQYFYHRGDGFGSPDLIKRQVLSLIVEPVQN